MNWFAMALGIDLGCLVALLWIVARAPLVEEDDVPPRPATEEPQRALLEPPTRIPAPGYAVRALAEPSRTVEVEVRVHDLARLAEERGPALAPDAFSRAMWEEERKGLAAIEWDELLWNQDHRLPREKRGAL